MSTPVSRDTVLRWGAATLIAASLATAGAAPLFADVVRLKNGQSLEGEVIEAGGQVKIRSAAGTIGFPADLVLRIERGDGTEKQALARLQSLAPNDVQGRVALALELQESGSTTLAQRIFESVLLRDPDQPTARRALGYVRCEDEWLTDEDCHRRHGQVLYQGRWVSTDERSVLDELEHARRQSELVRLRADIQIESARLQAEREAASTSYDDGYGSPYYDPYYYGGGLPYYPFYGYGGGGGWSPIRGGFRPGHDGGNDGRFPNGGPPRVDHFGGRGAAARTGAVPLHHSGGQPARPLQPQHNSHTMAPPQHTPLHSVAPAQPR
jgi:hypothetical protein